MIIDGRKIKSDILEGVRQGVLLLPFTPVFTDVIVGSDPASMQYVRMKGKTAESVGIKFREASFPESISTEELVKEIENLNRVPHMCGIIVQLPLPAHINKQTVLDAIDPSLDVDCLGSESSKLFYEDKNIIGFPAALACIKALDSTEVDLNNKNIVVLGRGNLVGKPVTHLLESRSLEVTSIDSKTDNKDEILKDADVIISGIGRGRFITGERIKNGAIVIDAGTSEENGSIIGDVDLDSVISVASYVSPTPGGVGPITVAILLQNVLTVAKQKK